MRQPRHRTVIVRIAPAIGIAGLVLSACAEAALVYRMAASGPPPAECQVKAEEGLKRIAAVRHAASKGDADAMLQLGKWYERSLTVPCGLKSFNILNEDHGQAYVWYRSAERCGNAQASAEIARLEWRGGFSVAEAERRLSEKPVPCRTATDETG